MAINIIMLKDVNGRLPFAFETSQDGSNKPGETYEQYELRMYYHEGVLPPRYPVPALPMYAVLDRRGIRIATLRDGEYGYGWYYK